MEGYPLIYGFCGHNSGNNNIYIYIILMYILYIYIHVYIYMRVHIMMTLIANNSDYTTILQ